MYYQINDRKFEIDDDKFWKDGKPFQIIGGDVHYFRILPEVFIHFFSLKQWHFLFLFFSLK